MKRNKKILIAGLATLVVAGSLTSVGFVYAASNNSPSQTTFISKVAQVLGISDQKLTSAVSQVATDNINQMLKDGKITQVQASDMIARIKSGNLPGFRGVGLPGIEMRKGRMELLNYLSKYLGITTSDIQTQLDGGKSFTDIITAHGKNISDAKTNLIQQVTSFVNEEIKNGKITKEESFLRISHLDKMVTF